MPLRCHNDNSNQESHDIQYLNGNDTSHGINDVSSTVCCDRDDCKIVKCTTSSKKSSEELLNGGPVDFSSTTLMQVLCECGMAWGMWLLDTGHKDGIVIHFCKPIPVNCTKSKLVDFNVKSLHYLLGGDINFLNMVWPAKLFCILPMPLLFCPAHNTQSMK